MKSRCQCCMMELIDAGTEINKKIRMDAILADINSINSLLEVTPESDILGRCSLNARLLEAKDELSKIEKEAE